MPDAIITCNSLNIVFRAFHPTRVAIFGMKRPGRIAQSYWRPFPAAKKSGPFRARSIDFSILYWNRLEAESSAGTVALAIALLVRLPIDRFVLIFISVG